MTTAAALRLLAPAAAAAVLAGCFGTGTKRVDASCREMRSTVVYEMLRDNPSVRLVDLRRSAEVTATEGRLQGALEIPFEKLPSRVGELGEHDATVIVFGRDPDVGRKGCQLLSSHGFRYVVFIADGAQGWFRNGLPAARPTPSPTPATAGEK